MIIFEECVSKNYPARTIENVTKSDITLAIAANFDTRGEILTKSSCARIGRVYIPMKLDFKVSDFRIKKLQERLNYFGRDFVLNIAGNGIYSIHETQDEVDKFVYDLIGNLALENRILLIRSGGQTGVDEAGIKAAEKLSINSICLAPKGWQFRDRNNRDIYSESEFKKRFI